MSVTLVGAIVLVAAPVASAAPYANGDVFAGVGRGEIREFTPSGADVQTLDTADDAFVQTGMCFDSADNLYATSDSDDTMTKFDDAGNILLNPFGSSYKDPESCVVDTAEDVYVGQAAGSEDILKFNSSGSLLSADDVAISTQVTGWIELAADQCSVLYTAYTLVGTSVKRYNVCTNTQLADFARGLPSPCADLGIRPNGEVLVTCSNAILRFDPAGALIQTYPVGSGLFALSLDPDGTSFWTAEYASGDIVRVDISSGDVLITFNADLNTFLAGLAVLGEPSPGQPIGPEFGETGIIDPISGTCGLREPGESSVGITDRTAADIGSKLNVANCVANLITAKPSGVAQEAKFFGQAAFRITQSKGFTTLKLLGQFFPALSGGASAADATAVTSGLRRKCRKPGFRRRNRRLCRRVLWGSGSGSYSTSGSYSSGTIRGTKWKTVDYVDQTTTFNKRGVVKGFDCAKKKKFVLKKGDKYVAKQNKNAKRGGRCGRKR